MTLSILLAFLILLSALYTNIRKNAKQEALFLLKDNHTILVFRLVYPIVIGLTLLLTYSNIGHINGNAKFWHISGAILFAAGMCIRWIAIYSLKNEFTVKVSILKNHHLKTDGIYSKIRHPSYIGILIYDLGLGLTCQNWLAILVLMTGMAIPILYRIGKEESVLEKHFGDAYLRYKKQTKRIIPWVY